MHNLYSLFFSFLGLMLLQLLYNCAARYQPIQQKCMFYKCFYIRCLQKLKSW